MKSITSASNPLFKKILNLRDKKHRIEEQLFTVEGAREVQRAIDCGLELVDLVALENGHPKQTIVVSQTLLNKLLVRDDSDGILGIFKYVTRTAEDFAKLAMKKHLTIVALENIEKPGNLGAIARSALLLGADAIVCLDHSVEAFNPNTIRASVGGVFEIPIFNFSSAEFYKICKAHKLEIYAAYLHEKSIPITKISFAARSVLLFGSEADGLNDFWQKHAHHFTVIPMSSAKSGDSFNLSNAVAIYLFERLKFA